MSNVHCVSRMLIFPKIKEQLPPGIELVDAPDFLEWKMDLRVLDTNPIYQNQTYRLRLRFNGKYPIEPPEVVFIQEKTPIRPIPMHPHVYSKCVVPEYAFRFDIADV